MYDCHSIFSRQTNQRNKLLVHVSYPYHAYVESRPEIKHSCWIEHGKLFAIFLWQTYTGKKSQVLSRKKLKKNLIDFHISNMFLYLILVGLFYQYSKKVWLSQKEYQKKQDFLFWLDLHVQLEENQPSLFFMKLKLIKMNSWMSKLTSDNKLSTLWAKFDFHIQVDLFLELPTS